MPTDRDPGAGPAGPAPGRREFSKTLVEALASWALLKALAAADALAGPARPILEEWVAGLRELALSVRGGRIAPAVWQDRVDALYRRIELVELLRRVDPDRLLAGVEYPDLGVATRPVGFPELDGLPEGAGFLAKLFGMRKDRAIIPHGHRNMVSCHYVLRGQFHLRQYDRVDEDDSHMIIRPTIDRRVGPGTYSSISDDRDNVHWLRALTGPAITFDVIVLDLGGGRWDVHNIDPRAAEPLGGGLLRAPRLDVETALARYGDETHHGPPPTDRR